MSIFKEFKEFALKGNAVDMAVGIIIGAAFGSVVSSLVADIIMPPIGYLLEGIDFSSFAITLQNATEEHPKISINYGLFLNQLINFTISAMAIFLVIKGMNAMKQKKGEKRATTKKCPECDMDIPVQAKKCGHCTSMVS